MLPGLDEVEARRSRRTVGSAADRRRQQAGPTTTDDHGSQRQEGLVDQVRGGQQRRERRTTLAEHGPETESHEHVDDPGGLQRSSVARRSMDDLEPVGRLERREPRPGIGLERGRYDEQRWRGVVGTRSEQRSVGLEVDPGADHHQPRMRREPASQARVASHRVDRTGPIAFGTDRRRADEHRVGRIAEPTERHRVRLATERLRPAAHGDRAVERGHHPERDPWPSLGLTHEHEVGVRTVGILGRSVGDGWVRARDESTHAASAADPDGGGRGRSMPHPFRGAPQARGYGPRMDDLIEIDTLTGGLSRVTAGYLVPGERPALLECGPALTIEHTVAGLEAAGVGRDDLTYLVVSHVHLDHAGGAGDLARAFPAATVVVSELGARHLVDPSRLNDSARRVYGPMFDAVYGPCTPIDATRVLGVGDGHRLDLGGGRRLELLWTPGHAKHHLAVLDHDSGALFTGDSVGVKLPGMRVIRPATPPADFQFETSLATLARYRSLDPTRLYLAHYGAVDPPLDALAEAEERLRAWVAAGEEAYRESSEVEHVATMLAHRFRDELEIEPGLVDAGDGAPDDETDGLIDGAIDGSADAPSGADADAGSATEVSRRLELLNGVASNAAGIVRYLSRRDAGTLTPIG